MSNVDLSGLAIDRGGTDKSIRPQRHLLTRYVLPLFLICGFLSLVGWAARDLIFPPTDVTVVPVFSTTAEVRQEGTPLFKAAGWIEPRPTPIRVAALAPGVVEKLLVVEDESVTLGQPVAELVKDDAKLIVERVTADFALRAAELDDARAQFRAAETRLNQPVHLEATLGKAEAALAKIQTELKNLPFAVRRAEADRDAVQKDFEGKLASKGVIAEIQIDIAKSKLDSAQALFEELRNRDASLHDEVTALTGQRDAVKTQLKLLADETEAKEQAEAQVKVAMARVEQARVKLEEAKLQLKRMTIVAPVDGRVFRLIAHPGARIGGGMTQMSGHDGSTVVTMYQPEMLQVRVDVRFEDIPKVSLTQPVEIDNPALSSPLIGEVLFTSSEADIQKNTLQVKVAILDPPPVFKPEMLVDVTFLQGKASTADAEESEDNSPKLVERIFVPKSLIQSEDDESYVWVADQSAGVARKTIIKTGASLGNDRVEVISGLNISTRLIATSTQKLTNGDRIKVTGEDASFGSDFQPPGS